MKGLCLASTLNLDVPASERMRKCISVYCRSYLLLSSVIQAQTEQDKGLGGQNDCVDRRGSALCWSDFTLRALLQSCLVLWEILLLLSFPVKFCFLPELSQDSLVKVPVSPECWETLCEYKGIGSGAKFFVYATSYWVLADWNPLDQVGVYICKWIGIIILNGAEKFA